MNPQGRLVIDVGQGFDHLPRAPIVEAVIDIKARASGSWDETVVRDSLVRDVVGYQYLDSQRQFEQEFKLESGKPSQVFEDLGWRGVRFRSADEKHVAQFNRDGFVFSRLAPYLSWDQFHREGLRLWSVFSKLAKPEEIHRVGLRFINRIPLPAETLRFEDYITPAPTSPRNLDLAVQSFMHHDVLPVAGYPYAINVTRTIQPPVAALGAGCALILDIDVFTTQAPQADASSLHKCLQEMRWLKNKVFFGCITEKAKEEFR